MTTSSVNNVETKRLRWRCRRGMLELDMVLNAFLMQYTALSPQQLAALDGFLDLPDQVFWALIMETPMAGIDFKQLNQDEVDLLSQLRQASVQTA